MNIIKNHTSNRFSQIWEWSTEFVMRPVETVKWKLVETRRTIWLFIDKGNRFSQIWEWSTEFVTRPVETVKWKLVETRRTVWFFIDKDPVRRLVEFGITYLRRLWPSRDKENLQNQIEQLKAEIEFSEARIHRVNVILDPSTAHPRLEVSQDGKRVRDTGSVLKVPNSEERFDSHMFVLAKEGFVKGKHYWEVEVGQKKNWDLGVASESISRKGRITLAPQNGYWVIGLDGKKDYWARTDPWTHLDLSGKPTKIGMFLNMSTRNLSFYDVKGKRKLYTFTVKHSGKLYPFFSTGSVTETLDSQSLKVLPWPEEEETESSQEG